MYAEVSKIYGKKESSVCEIMKKEEEIHASFAVWSQTAELRPQGFPGGAVVKNLPASAGDTGSSPGPGRSHMPRSN